MISGNSMVLDIENHNFVVSNKNFVPHDPRPFKPKRLQVSYSYDNNEPPLTIERQEHSRLVLPQDSEMERLTREIKELVDKDATNITSRIRHASQRIEFHFSPGSDPYLDITTELWNGSVFQLVSFGEIAGHVTYGGKQLAAEPRVIVSVEPPLLNLGHGDSLTLVVRQYLSSEVADMMQANRNRGVAIDFRSVFVSFKVLPLDDLTKMGAFRWQGPRFAIEEASRV
jgi:hypothetical protein